MTGGDVLRDVVFAAPVGFRPLALDLHRPAGGPAPVVVLLHGGGWRLGSRRGFLPRHPGFDVIGRIAEAGFAVAAVDYRLSGEARFPAQVEDALAAIAWLREHGAEHGIDGERIVLWGESAGAHLAALAGLAAHPGVAGVVGWFGPADLTALGRQLHPDDPDAFDADPATREAQLLGGPVGQRRSEARAASPLFQVHAGAPPFLLLHGEADELVPIAHSEALAAALAEHGNEAELVRVPGAGHFWDGVADLGPILDRSLAFAAAVAARVAQ